MTKRPLLLVGALLVIPGCSGGMARIDERVASIVAEVSADMGSSVHPDAREIATPGPTGTDPFDERPKTVNPRATDLEYVAATRREAEEVIARLEGYVEDVEGARELTLAGALEWAIDNAREYRFAEEEYVLASLRLLIEEHRWGPRFFDEVSAVVLGAGESSQYDTALELVNEFRVTQRLPYGGEVSASLLAQATEDLHTRVSGENVQSADLLLSANVPLLRGAGEVAREDLIQRQRDMVYAARDFERFRREFLFDIARDYFDLVVLRRRIVNRELQVRSFEEVQAREKARHLAGRATTFEADEASNRTLESRDTLNGDRERLRVAMDQFKVRIGMPVEERITVQPDRFDLPVPQVTLEDAVLAAMTYRLDLQTERDLVDDARRGVAIAKNNLLGDLDLQANFRLPTDSTKDRAGLDFEPSDISYSAGVTYGLPLDREIERLGVRQAEISFERAIRSYDRFRDDIAINVRSAVRGIDAALFSLEIQERSVEVAERRKAAIDADPARATIRDKTDAITDIAAAQDSRDDADRNVQVAILSYLLSTGQLRVDSRGQLQPLAGMSAAIAPPGRFAATP